MEDEQILTLMRTKKGYEIIIETNEAIEIHSLIAFLEIVKYKLLDNTSLPNYLFDTKKYEA